MGTGISNLYSGTYGSTSVPGSTDYMEPTDDFSVFIQRRKDKDLNGFYDYIAHGDQNTIKVTINGVTHIINHRVAAELIKRDKKRTSIAVRLLSCETGKGNNSFAQNLANKLNIKVKAPTKLLWCSPNGNYFVADAQDNDPNRPDLNKKGKFKTFYPGGNKK